MRILYTTSKKAFCVYEFKGSLKFIWDYNENEILISREKIHFWVTVDGVS